MSEEDYIKPHPDLIAKIKRLTEGVEVDACNPTAQYKAFNHHHELADDQRMINLGTGQFVADKKMIPLLKALNSIGLITRTHCIGHENDHAFVGILMHDVDIQVRKATEQHSARDFDCNELIINWLKKPTKETEEADNVPRETVVVSTEVKSNLEDIAEKFKDINGMDEVNKEEP